MAAAADGLEVVRLGHAGITAALHAEGLRTSLELFTPDGRMLLVATHNPVHHGVRGIWAATTPRKPRALIAVGTLEHGAPLPLVRFTRRRRSVRAWLTCLGPFWLAEATGRRLRLQVDDGHIATTATSGRAVGPVAVQQGPSELTGPLFAVEETS